MPGETQIQNDLIIGPFYKAPYRRARILARLSSACEHPVSLLLAPAGYGKSTAISEFLEECSAYILIRVPYAASLRQFVGEFSRACAEHVPQMGTPPEEFSTSQETVTESVELYASWITRHLTSSKCFVAVDDIHQGDGDPGIAMLIARLVEGTLSSIKWILSSRTRSGLPVSRWRAYGYADEPILADELRINSDEAMALARELGSPATTAQLEQWLRQTNGFPVPLSYAIRLSARRGSVEGVTDGTRALTFEFLADHLWSSLSVCDKDLLEVAAFLPDIHIHQFESAGIEGASTRLAALSADIAFLNLKSNGDFGIHDLFKEFVIQRVFTAGPAALLQRRLAAVRILTTSKKYEDALRILLNCGDQKRIITFMEETGEHIKDHTVIREFIEVCEQSGLEEFGIKILSVLADYWAWHGDALKSKLFASKILAHPSASSSDRFLAVRSWYRSIDVQTQPEQREWLTQVSEHFDSLSNAEKIQVDAFRASILARYEESQGQAKQLIAQSERFFYHLRISDRLSAEIAVANASHYLDDASATLKFARAAVATATELGDLRQQARTLNNLGIILHGNYDPEVESLFEPLKNAVESTGSWRFSHVSHWFPSFYFALKSDGAAFKETLKLQSSVHPLEESQRKLLNSFRRCSENLGYILSEYYEAVIRDFLRNGPPVEAHLSYTVHVQNAVANLMMSRKIEAIKMLNAARDLRSKLRVSQMNWVQENILMEVLCLGATGQWSRARKLCEHGIGSAAALAPAKEMLRRFCDGPPFVGLREAQVQCVDKPFVGLAAVLVKRTIDRIHFGQVPVHLTTAETDVLKLLSLGKSNKAIADARSRSTETVKRQVAAIYKKLGVENRTSALAAAKELGLVQ